MPSSSPNKVQRLCLYDSTELEQVIRDMARQALALLPPGPCALVGILRRGEPLARMLQQQLALLSGQPELSLFALKVKRYADDLSVLHAHTALTESAELAALDLANTQLLVIDDVLYQGHSLLRTCAYLSSLGAQQVRTAVLVDRCVSQQPIRADIVGVRLQVAPGDIIECNVPPYEPQFRIEVVRQSH